MTRWIFLAALLIAFGFAGFYTYLGGFRAAAVTLETIPQPIFLAGRYFAGPVSSDEFGPLFRQAQQLRQSGQLRGDLANIYYNDPAAAKDTVKAFVGLVVADTTSQQLPANYHYRTFAAGQRVLHARIQASYMVAPDKLYSGVKNFAEKEQLKLRQVYLERFGDDDRAEVLAVVK
ncbi:hypothetical protein SAMN02745146_0851 [Hymenobacter daecheongensis DSM 21074]|uniref:GyrI-like small molecule binding domain-containing protein n=1 Tax=Hymenobacter daecheongensis DSM 21074 TaxID=1121955 RepID=A0A1M6B2D3_9BACT|nr:hypothetical protein [Hymenobacter daecheongensis]SHI42912.1 hypothetical protein SAMN02745146_0851 [Hymenobacter daecheongensis DSM 21074]